MNNLLPAGEKIGLTNCDREPIHTPGGIQPIGFLIATSADWIVQRAANTLDHLGVAAADLPGTPLSGVLQKSAIDKIRSRIALLRSKDAVERVFEVPLVDGGKPYDIAVHFSGNSVIVECEPAQGDQIEVSSLVRSSLTRLGSCQDVSALLKEGARQFRSLMNYDRVMMYRFAEDGSGEVVSQSLAPDIDSYIGLNFPATDIPQQARALYLRNTFRIIADVQGEAVPIEPVGEGKPLDLSLALFRAVSPIHLEYLRNMGVGASLSVSIVVDGKLWGMIVCHHDSPRLPSFAERSAAELFGQIFSLQIESKVREQISESERRARHVSNRLMSAAAQDKDRLADADWLCELLPQAIECDGIGVHVEGTTALSGLAPTKAQFMKLVDALNRRDAQTIQHSSRIAELLPELADANSPLGGMLSIPISRRPRDYLILFREEKLRSVRWAGNQAKSVEQGEDGPRLTPRKSFEEWSELVRGTSEPFAPSDVRTAESLRATLLEVVLHLSEEANEDRKRAAEQQQLLIAELNHRVRNILALIRALMAQTKREGGTIDEVVDTLESRVKALANAHDLLTADNWVPASFREILKIEFAAYLSKGSDRVRLSGPEVSIKPQAVPIVALVLHEMATNAAKYGALSDSGSVNIDWSVDGDGHLHFTWKEMGGPMVEPPSRKGFGTTVITSSIPHELGGEAEVNYKPSGLQAQFCIPERHVVAQVPVASATMPQSSTSGSVDAFKGKTVLLVEDSMIIALDAEDKLRDLGADNVLLAASVERAFEMIRSEKIDVAMLDFNLGQETSLPIAEQLMKTDVPFFFASGYGGDDVVPPEFSAIPLVVKPYTLEQIAAAAADALS